MKILREMPTFDCAAGRHNLEYDGYKVVEVQQRFLFWTWTTTEDLKCYVCLDCKKPIYYPDESIY